MARYVKDGMLMQDCVVCDGSKITPFTGGAPCGACGGTGSSFLANVASFSSPNDENAPVGGGVDDSAPIEIVADEPKAAKSKKKQ